MISSHSRKGHISNSTVTMYSRTEKQFRPFNCNVENKNSGWGVIPYCAPKKRLGIQRSTTLIAAVIKSASIDRWLNERKKN